MKGVEWTPFSFYSRSVLRITAEDGGNFTCQVRGRRNLTDKSFPKNIKWGLETIFGPERSSRSANVGLFVHSVKNGLRELNLHLTESDLQHSSTLSSLSKSEGA